MKDSIHLECIIGPLPMSSEQTKVILSQLDNCICKVYPAEDKKGTGFFCLLPNPDICHLLPVLITNNHVLNEDDLKKEKIKIQLNENIIYLKLNNRKKFTFEKPIDVTVIEIKPDIDNLNINKNFLYIDNEILDENNKHLEKNTNIYVLQIPEGALKSHSTGMIYKIEEDTIYHTCSTKRGSSGGAILCVSHQKVIGVHRGWKGKGKEEVNENDKNTYDRINLGTLIKTVIDKFKKESSINLGEHSFEKATIINKNTKTKRDKYPKDDNIKYYYYLDAINKTEKPINLHKNKRHDIINIIEMVLENNNDSKDIYFLSKDGLKEFDNDNNIDNLELYINNKKINKFDKHCGFPNGRHEIRIVFNGIITDCSNMFKDCQYLIEINLSNFNTEEVTNMSYMFHNCKNLSNIDLSNINTENVINMSHMFHNCNNLSNIILSKINTKNVEDMGHMFYNCNNLSYIDLSSFDTKKVINMEKMFCECENVKKINFSYDFNTMKVTKMSGMFKFCKKLENLDLTYFNTKNVLNMAEMFSVCSSLQKINLSSFNTKNVKKMYKMFDSCTSLKIIELSYSFNTENVTNMCEMFNNCQNLEKLDLSSFRTENVTKMNKMFNSCNELISLDLSSFNINKVETMEQMFDNCSKLVILNIKNFDIKGSVITANLFSQCNNLKTVYIDENVNISMLKNILRENNIKANITII